MISITVQTAKGVVQDIHEMEAAIFLFARAAEILKLKCDSEQVIRDWVIAEGIYSVRNETTSIIIQAQ